MDVNHEGQAIGDVVASVKSNAVDKVVIDSGGGSTFGLFSRGAEASFNSSGLDRGGDLKSFGRHSEGEESRLGIVGKQFRESKVK